MTFRSPFPDVEIPDVSLTEYVLGHADALGDKPALIDAATGRTISYAELPRLIRETAAGLARRGIAKGDVVAIYSCNVPEYAIAFHAIASLGGVVTTVNPLYTEEELVSQLVDSGAKLILSAPENVARAREAMAGTAVAEVIVFGEAEGATPFASLVEKDDEPPEVVIDPREDLVALPYSSGTTGLPKGVMLTHHNLVANLCQFSALGHISADDTLVCILPMYHIYGMTVVMNGGLLTGATIVTMSRFDLEQFLRVLQDYRVTFAHVVPPIVLALSKHPAVDAYDLSALRVVFSGAAPLGPELSRECIHRLGCSVMQGYGMTEASPGTHSMGADPSHLRLGSVGTLVPSTECRVVDVETGDDVGAGREGEIWVRGPQVMKGYLNSPGATARTVDAEGWLHTGDVGYVDREGYFYIVDRVKELIKFKGFQIAPAELEALLLTHPAVADAAVVPRPDPEAGEVPVAFVVRRGAVTAEELMDYVAGHVAPYKKIRSVEFLEVIPKSPSGKILRRVLRDRLRHE
jgi:acyl-CoA synthetase (AMP-forming)/AMP-acid ligase II